MCAPRLHALRPELPKPRLQLRQRLGVDEPHVPIAATAIIAAAAIAAIAPVLTSASVSAPAIAFASASASAIASASARSHPKCPRRGGASP